MSTVKRTVLGALLASVLSAGCIASEDPPVSANDDDVVTAKGKRFNADHPAPVQTDDWSCSVHTTTWMLQSTGHDVTHATVAGKMRGAGRVSPAVGLTDASGKGLAQTLRDIAEGSPNIGSTPAASFDEVAERAGKMAVGIGGRAWYHWSAVRGYDAEKDVILLANSAPSWKGAGQELTRAEFKNLGAFSMVWMDYGKEPEEPPAPFVPTPRPMDGPFPALHVKTAIDDGNFVTQCSESADGERVWQTDGTGPDVETRWAVAKYPQLALGSCGDPKDGVYPLVFKNHLAGQTSNQGKPGPKWEVVQCNDQNPGHARTFRVESEVDRHPAAVLISEAANPDCR